MDPTPVFMDEFTRATKLVRALAEAGMRKHGLHLGQNLVLAQLAREDGRTPGELAAALNVTTPTVTKMTTRMAAAGLLTRRRDEKDNRLVRLWLTEDGRALCRPVEAERCALSEELLAGLDESERAALIGLLRRVSDNAGRLHDGPVDHE